jgi:tetratricopeptide (TPR) repeat protein
MLMALQDLGTVLGALQRWDAAESLLREALTGYERNLGSADRDTLRTLQNLAQLLENTGRADEAKALRLRHLDAVTAKADTTPLELRTAALDAYRLGDYALAQRLLQRVLDQGFEIPGTHVLLSRLALLRDDARAFEQHAAQAWQHRAEAPPYVLPRILWLQLAADLLSERSGGPARTPSILLGRLKTALQTKGAHMEWTMTPVLDHLQPRLSPEDHALLTALVAALSDASQLAALDALPAWRAAEPQPLE